MLRRFSLAGIVVIAIVLIFFTQEIVYLISDFLWFDRLNFSSTYWTLISSNLLLIAIFSLLFLSLFTLNYFALRIISKRESTLSPLMAQIREKFPRWEKRANLIIFLISAIILTFLMGQGASGKWQEYLLAIHQSPFQISDPIFQQDLSFYIFTLPFLNFSLNWFVGGLFLIFLFTIAYYVLNGYLSFQNGLSIDSHAWAHLSALLGILVAFKGIDFWFSKYSVLNSKLGTVYGAGYTDINALVFAYNTLTILSLLFAFILWYNIFRKSITMPLYGAAALFAVYILLKMIYPSALQEFSVEPNELKKEEKYIQHNINFTQKAYGLQKIEESPYPAADEFNLKALSDVRGSLENVRLWDYRPLKQTYGQLQEIRLYYKFHDVDIDRYTINGKKRLVMLSARELEVNDLPEKAKTWINIHMKYTHGYGVVLSPVNEITPDGLPTLLIKDIPPQSSIDIKIKQPEIYFGELTNQYVLVNTTEKEFDYPVGDSNKYTSYEGKGGISIGSFGRKLLYALRFKSSKIFLARGITSESKILYTRNVRERIRTIAPFLYLDEDPYVAIINGRLKYIVDAYSISKNFPYAEPFSKAGYNYIRNSVKVVVDAYDGNVQFYIYDEKDPIIQTYRKIFPDLFQPRSAIPEEIKKHLRYPVTLFNVQMNMYRSYHMKNVQVFYNKEDLWEIPQEIYEDQKIPMEAYYQLINLPGESKLRFNLMLPFTPRGKNNLIALASAVNQDDYNYKLMVYKMPKQKLSYGPMQFEARVDQNPEISKQLSLWSQKGSRVIRGNILILPLMDSLLYVEPLYLKAEQSELPELKQVIIAHGSKVIMEKNFELALRKILSGTSFEDRKQLSQSKFFNGSKELAGLSRDDLVKEAKKVFNEAQQILRKGDLEAYGRKIKELEKILQNL